MDALTLSLSLGPWAPVLLAWLRYRVEIRQAFSKSVEPPSRALVTAAREAAQRAENAESYARQAKPLDVRALSREAAKLASEELSKDLDARIQRALDVRVPILRTEFAEDRRMLTPVPASDVHVRTEQNVRTDQWAHALRAELAALVKEVRAETAKLAEEKAEGAARRSLSEIQERIASLDHELQRDRVEDARALGRLEGAALPPGEGLPPGALRRRR